MAGLCFCFFALVLLFVPLPSDQIGGGFIVCYFSLSFSSFIWFLDDDGMEREACVCDHGFERSDLPGMCGNNNNNNNSLPARGKIARYAREFSFAKCHDKGDTTL